MNKHWLLQPYIQVAFTALWHKWKKDTADWTFGKENSISLFRRHQDRCSIWTINTEYSTHTLSWYWCLHHGGQMNRNQQVSAGRSLYIIIRLQSSCDKRGIKFPVRIYSRLKLNTQTPCCKKKPAEHTILKGTPQTFNPSAFHSERNVTPCPLNLSYPGHSHHLMDFKWTH